MSECIEVGWSRGKSRYRDVYVRGKGKMLAHRAAWEAVHGPIPKGVHVCHHCDNPACSNVEHLFLGTVQDNMRDRDEKLRQVRGARMHSAKLTEDQVRSIKARPLLGEHPDELARQFGVTPGNIRNIKAGRIWSWI